MDTQAIRAQMPVLVAGHVPRNVRSFKFNIFDGQPKVSTWGFHIDPKPFEGKVIADTGEAIVVKIGRAEFAVLDRALLTEVPVEGAKVQVQPYARRRFDGLRADTPEERTEYASDGTPFKMHTHPRLRTSQAADPASTLPGVAGTRQPARTAACSRRFPTYHPLAGGCRRTGVFRCRSTTRRHNQDASGNQLHSCDSKVPGSGYRAVRPR
ncbi:hypothetical protein PS874_01444 [Pseudomonas fluorescens]|nr:hypothetical protein PS874_01444 [Pseudomonas fluorescens]